MIYADFQTNFFNQIRKRFSSFVLPLQKKKEKNNISKRLTHIIYKYVCLIIKKMCDIYSFIYNSKFVFPCNFPNVIINASRNASNSLVVVSL